MDEAKTFPRTMVGGVSLPRMICGTNWLLGYSHTGGVADKMIRDYHHCAERMASVIETYLDEGCDALMAPYSTQPMLQEAVRLAEEHKKHKVIIIDTPGMNVDDTPEARREAEATIRHSREVGSTFCLIHHASAEQLVNKNLRQIPRLPDYLAMIRDQGLIPGLSAHMPELVTYSDLNGYDVETYIQIFNCLGFLMQVEVESVYKLIRAAKKPVMTIKPMAAGRTTPFIGLTFNFSVLRDCDMVTCGCLTAAEAREDIEIARAAIERRQPFIEGRHSPVKTDVIK